jgi:hypothetical protein
MDENTWRIVQMAMWLVGIQTTVIIAVFGAMWASMLRRFDAMDKKFTEKFEILEKKIEKLDEKVTDIDRRVCRLEGAFNNKECCMIKDPSQLKKAE